MSDDFTFVPPVSKLIHGQNWFDLLGGKGSIEEEPLTAGTGTILGKTPLLRGFDSFDNYLKVEIMGQ